ncbi:MAG: GLPGLI family protein [Bacteroidetes bacterium]|nr:MAG: GLPGLI family protein [Bacteroidota bacterium]
MNPLKVTVFLAILASNYTFAQQPSKSIRLEYLGYAALAANSFKTIDTKNTVTVSKGVSESYQSTLDVNRPQGDTLVRYFKSNRSSVIYKDRQNNTLYFENGSKLVKSTKKIFSDSLNSFNWVITNATKNVGDFECVKALCIWRGRAYAAWFTETIPLAEGPWKFGGLPGLIVELYDEEKTIYWKLETMTEVAYQNFSLPKAEGTFLEFKKMYKDAAQRLVAANEAQEEIDPNCTSCNKSIRIKIETIENLTD